MSDIAIVDSPSRQIDKETFEQEIDDFSIDNLSLQSGAIATSIEEKFDFSQYRAIYVRVGSITEAVFDQADNLEIVSTCGSGYDHIDIEAATEHGVMVTNTPGAPAPGVIEHTFGVMFTLLHRFPEMFELTAEGKWEEGQITVGELCGKKLGVVGLGTIGSEIAEIAQSRFNADVVAYDPYVSEELCSPIYPRVSKEEMASLGIELVNKQTLFETADIVSLHVPHTERTRGMVSEAELSGLAGGYLINTSRGEVVDEDALVDAVKRDQLAGVALDVMRSEPPESSNPLLTSSNVYVTPHIAGGTEGYAERSARINADRIQQVLQDKRPENLVNPGVLE